MRRKELGEWFARSQCSKAVIISNDLLYHDMRRKFMIWLLHSGKQDAKPLKDPVFEQEEMLLTDYRLRIVASHSQLLEKILAFSIGGRIFKPHASDVTELTAHSHDRGGIPPVRMVHGILPPSE